MCNKYMFAFRISDFGFFRSLILTVIVMSVLCSESETNKTISVLRILDEKDIIPLTLGQRAAQLIRNRLLRRNEKINLRLQEICYEMVGCFTLPRTRVGALKQPPQPPDVIDTKFLLLTPTLSSSNESPEIIKYGDNLKSLTESSFEPNLPTKIVVHGFKGRGNDTGALKIAAAILALENCNVILVDWHKGASGPSYVTAASNTQLVGRQIALLMSDMQKMGSDENRFHIIGFSLGSHIAGYAGRYLQKKGLKVGRISGLDPASPLFREFISNSLSPLNKKDASFVDVIHTDSTRFLSDGLGLFRPIGHVDFFPNGGMHQPGCEQSKKSMLANHIGGSLNRSSVCNHIRAWQLFYESIKDQQNGCQFFSFPCPNGWSSFDEGTCFPSRCTDENCAKMGYFANSSRNHGPHYLTTYGSSPYCGHQLKAAVLLSQSITNFRGSMKLTLLVDQQIIHFQLFTNKKMRDELEGGSVVNGVTAAQYGTISAFSNVTAQISCQVTSQKSKTKGSLPVPLIAIDEVIVRDIFGNKWGYQHKNKILKNFNGSNIEAVTVPLIYIPIQR